MNEKTSTSVITEEIEGRVKDRLQILSKKYSFMNCLISLEIIPDDEGTLAITKNSICINTEYIELITNSELDWALLLLGNILDKNLILEHVIDMDYSLYNAATCYFINSIIKSYNDPELKMPEGLLYNSNYDGKLIMEIYDMIKEKGLI